MTARGPSMKVTSAFLCALLVVGGLSACERSNASPPASAATPSGDVGGGGGPAQGDSPLPSVTLPPELDRVLRDYERAWRARDAAGLAALFAADGFVLSDGIRPVRGRADIERRYSGQGGALSLRAIAYSTADSVGYIIGLFAPEAGARDVGKFVLALRRPPGGAWEIAADMDNGIRR